MLSTLLCASTSGAQSLSDVTRAIAGAHRELIVVLPQLSRTDIAKAVKQAAAQGTKVFVIYPAVNVKGGGYLLNVSHGPATISTYLFKGAIPSPWVMVDGAWVVTGAGLEDQRGQDFRVVQDRATLVRLNQWARQVTAGGPTDRVEIIKRRYSK